MAVRPCTTIARCDSDGFEDRPELFFGFGMTDDADDFVDTTNLVSWLIAMNVVNEPNDWWYISIIIHAIEDTLRDICKSTIARQQSHRLECFVADYSIVWYRLLVR